MGQTFVADGSIGAVVLDIGNINSRVGYAGTDVPAAIYPSAIGTYHDSEGRMCSAVEMDTLGWAHPELQVNRLHNCRQGEEQDVVVRLE